MTGDALADVGQTTQPLTSIVVGERHRKVLGDLTALADSIATVGLLHPVVITPDNLLVAGARRLAAAEMLGWTDIPVRVVELSSLLRAEHDENVLREPFLPTEAVAIGRALEAEIRAQNAVRQREGRKKGGHTGGRARRGRVHRQQPVSGDSLVPTNHQAIQSQKTRVQVGKAVGMGGTTYTKAKAVVIAAEVNPERYGDLVVQMDETATVDNAYQTMQRRQATDALPGKSPHQLTDEEGFLAQRALRCRELQEELAEVIALYGWDLIWETVLAPFCTVHRDGKQGDLGRSHREQNPTTG